MITKERLKELIEQGATVYMARAYTEGIYLLPENFEANDKELVFKYKIYAVPLEDLFETEEDAKWFAEFGCIERTERLNITDWQKFKNRDENFGFTVEDYSYKCFTDGIKIELVEFWGQGGRSLFKAALTKENYTLACRKAKELFLGEKK